MFFLAYDHFFRHLLFALQHILRLLQRQKSPPVCPSMIIDHLIASYRPEPGPLFILGQTRETRLISQRSRKDFEEEIFSVLLLWQMPPQRRQTAGCIAPVKPDSQGI